VSEGGQPCKHADHITDFSLCAVWTKWKFVLERFFIRVHATQA